MKTVRILTAAAAALLLAACGPKTVIDGTLTGKAVAPVIVKLLDVNKYQVLDTVKTNASGAFTYQVEFPSESPEFIYLFYGDRKVASLLMGKGDRVKMNRFAASEAPDANAELSRRYVDYYRRSTRYVLEHSKSLTAVPVLFQRVNENLPVFNQPTDGILFRSISDSLRTVYPDSRYVKALEQEAARRTNAMEISHALDQAGEVGYFDIDLPTTDGSTRKLSESDAKVVMLYFWATTAEQKMFNMDALIPLYNEFHGRGFEIYAVSLDTDKTAWASAVRNQQLPWVNVCDTRGNASPYVGLYGLSSLPMAYFLVDGDLDGNAKVTDAASIRKYLNSKL